MATTVLEEPAQAVTPASHDVAASFNYIDASVPGHDLPIQFPEDHATKENILELKGNIKPLLHHQAVVTDVGDDFSKCLLDTHGFQYFKHQTQCTEDDYIDSERMKSNYLPEVADLLKKITGASFVHIYDHVTRGPVKGTKTSITTSAVHYVHCDQSYYGAKAIFLTRIPDYDVAEEIVDKKRFAVYNLWRPVKTVLRDPFACVDARTVEEGDLVKSPIMSGLTPDRGAALAKRTDVVVKNGRLMEESWAASPSERHRWYYKHAQKPDEVLVFKCFDSIDDGKTARRTIHSAFSDPAGVDLPERESVEVRALLAWD